MDFVVICRLVDSIQWRYYRQTCDTKKEKEAMKITKVKREQKRCPLYMLPFASVFRYEGQYYLCSDKMYEDYCTGVNLLTGKIKEFFKTTEVEHLEDCELLIKEL